MDIITGLFVLFAFGTGLSTLCDLEEKIMKNAEGETIRYCVDCREYFPESQCIRKKKRVGVHYRCIPCNDKRKRKKK